MITKKDIARALNKQKIGGLDHKASKQAVDFIFDYIGEELYACKKIQIVGLFTIYLDVQKPKRFYNANKSKMDMLPYRWKFYIKLSSKLNDKIKSKPCYAENGEE
jgi:nucleoid DNA-binding protein